MSRISFLVGYDRIAQSGMDLPESEVSKKHSQHAASNKGEEYLEEFWEETRLGLVQRMRYVSAHSARLVAKYM